MIYLNIICILIIIFDIPYYIVPVKVVHCLKYCSLSCHLIDNNIVFYCKNISILQTQHFLNTHDLYKNIFNLNNICCCDATENIYNNNILSKKFLSIRSKN